MTLSARPDDRPVEQALRELLAPLDRHLERGRTVLATALVLVPAPFLLLWLLSRIEAKHAAGWSVLAFGATVVAGLGWEVLMGRWVRWRFDRRFPAGTPARAVALGVLERLESPNKVEDKLREALGATTAAAPEAPPPTDRPPLLELPTTKPDEPRPTAKTPRPGYYDYIPLEPLGGEKEAER